jgi:hypothetical protein
MANMKTYNMVIPEKLFDEIKALADSKGTTVKEIIRQFIKLGMIAAKIERKPDSALILRTGDKDTEIILT